MESKTEKVYVAIGANLRDGFSTLQWALRKWSNHAISIVIFHAPNSISKDYVYTPLCRLPVSSVSEEKLKVIEKTEEANSDKILSQYIAFCGKVKAEVLRIEKNDQPLHSQLVEMISSFRITKLVMSFTFMNSSSWKSRTAISGCFYVLRKKPDFCEMFVICGGRLVLLREENDEGFVEDDRGFMVMKFKERNHSIKNWLGRMLPENAINDSPDSPSSSKSNSSPHQWEKCCEEIEQYVNQLLSLNEDEEEINVENETLKENSRELDIKENTEAAERIRVLKLRIQNVQDSIQLNRNQAIAFKERREKAEWAISICKSRVEELEACINEDVLKSIDLKKELYCRKEEITELKSEMEEKRRKLNTILELQKELSDKLKLSSSAKSRAEIQLEKAVKTRASMVQEIEELRTHKDVLQRRIEFCREKDAIVKVSKLNGYGFDFREFTASDIRAATKDFSEHTRLKSAGEWTNVYRGRINHITVAIKIYNSASAQSQEAFKTEVKILNKIRHPNLLAMIGFCSELNCIVFEYMHHGSLHDALLSTERRCKRKNPSLTWHVRIRIAAEICSALAFLHKAKPKPIIHGNLNPSKILLDQNNIAKVHGLKSSWSYDESDIKLDIRAFGNLVLQLLTGKNWAVAMDIDAGIGGLDHLDGEWPMDLAMELFSIALRCLSNNSGTVENSITALPMKEIDDMKERADWLVANGEFHVPAEGVTVEDLSSVSTAFFCPIYQDVMQNPHLAADGFSYELEAIDAWLQTGHDTSPMTNLKLKHKLLTPNHTLRFLIQDWQSKKLAAPNSE